MMIRLIMKLFSTMKKLQKMRRLNLGYTFLSTESTISGEDDKERSITVTPGSDLALWFIEIREIISDTTHSLL